MSWLSPNTFALPCGGGGGAEMHAATLPAGANTESVLFAAIPGLEVAFPVAFRRRAAIWLMGSVSNDTGGQLCQFSVRVDGMAVDEVCDVLVPNDDAIQTVSLGCQVILEPGDRVVEAVWRTMTGSGHLSSDPYQLHLKVILGQAAP